MIMRSWKLVIPEVFFTNHGISWLVRIRSSGTQVLCLKMLKTAARCLKSFRFLLTGNHQSNPDQVTRLYSAPRARKCLRNRPFQAWPCVHLRVAHKWLNIVFELEQILKRVNFVHFGLCARIVKKRLLLNYNTVPKPNHHEFLT